MKTNQQPLRRLGFCQSPTLALLGLWIIALTSVPGGRARAGSVLQRVPNTTLQLPQIPQSFGYQTEKALGNLTFTSPVAVAAPPGETNRLFVVEQGGRIMVVTNLMSPSKAVFLDISKRIVANDAEGLFGMAFHPDYAKNGYFYLCYNLRTTTGAGTGEHYRVARFQVLPEDPDKALPDGELPLITQKNKSAQRTCNDLAFGPEGYLYIAVGWTSTTLSPQNHSQRIDGDLEGGILRIDVDQKPGNPAPNPHPASSANYAIPLDNPFVGATSFNGVAIDPLQVRTEYYATGLRNPWRISFDQATGLLYSGDAGESQREEINLITKGGDYGWAFREGTLNGPKVTGTPAGAGLIGPIHEYSHSGAPSVVIGGLVYHGARLPQLYGAYVFGDYLTGSIWALRPAGTNQVPSQKLLTELGIVGFGRDPRNDDVLVVNHESGAIKRLVYSTKLVGTPLPPTLADTGAFLDLSTLTPQPGIVPYDLNVAFWSDNAVKTRWFSVPPLEQTITFAAQSHWLFPTGTVWIKHFELEMTKGVPASARRIETRFLVRNANGVHGLTYRWGDSTLNALLVPEEGMDEEFEINDGGANRQQVWHYPSRAECLLCHTPGAGHALGFNTHQLNRPSSYEGVVENQIRALSDAGYFKTSATNIHTLPALAPAANTAVSLDYRVHSYLAANCVQCHQPGGIGRGLFDTRLTTPLSASGVINGPLLNQLEDPENRVITPGSLGHSVLFSRLSQLGPTHMPPLATTVLNQTAIELLDAWIMNGLINHESYADWQQSHFGSTTATGSAPDEDPDGDGATNELEYLTHTNPLLAGDGWGIRLAVVGDGVQIQYNRTANRGFEVQWTSDLFDSASWQPLDVAGNEPVFAATDAIVTVQDLLGAASARFYRVRVFEP